MDSYLLDSSAIVKLYIEEQGSDWMRSVRASGSVELYVSRICGVEVVAALARAQREKRLSPEQHAIVRQDFLADFSSRFTVLETSAAVLKTAMALADSQPLRGYDAVQLATAYELFVPRVILGMDPAVFLTSDLQLIEVAVSLGIETDNPSNH